jgi:hypothetical protein
MLLLDFEVGESNDNHTKPNRSRPLFRRFSFEKRGIPDNAGSSKPLNARASVEDDHAFAGATNHAAFDAGAQCSQRYAPDNAQVVTGAGATEYVLGPVAREIGRRMRTEEAAWHP